MNNEARCCTNTSHISGCMVCGRELFYIPEKSIRANCFYCGKEYITDVFCLTGHYVCDECHRKDILELIEYECMNSNLTDPVELALRIFNLPMLHMNGPEYHSIVPAVLITAYCNSINMKDTALIEDAISRGKELPGGLCGTHGACGACIGVGIAYSIIHHVTPFSKEDRGKANQMTAHALTAISRTAGPRCCKRDSMIAIETAMKNFGCFSDSGKTSYVCKQFPYNDKCIKSECIYYPIIDYDNA